MKLEFRVFDKKGNRLIYDISVENLFLSCNGNLVDINRPELYLMDNYVKSFYTGITDSQGVKIFEGDIIKISWLAELGITELDCETRAIVEYNQSEARYLMAFIVPYRVIMNPEMEYEEYYFSFDETQYNEDYEITVIGNKWQNPELIAT